MIARVQQRGRKRDASTLWLHSPRPFRDPRVSLPSHRGWALALSATLVLLLLSLAPASWVRWLIPPPPHGDSPPVLQDSELPGVIQLMPHAAVRPPASSQEVPVLRVEVPKAKSPADEDEETVTEDAAESWVFDPTRPHRIARDLLDLERGQRALADSTLARAQLYRELASGRWNAAALIDTSRMAWVRSQWREVDDWFSRVYGPRWIAQGDSARSRDIYERAVTEAERRGLH